MQIQRDWILIGRISVTTKPALPLQTPIGIKFNRMHKGEFPSLRPPRFSIHFGLIHAEPF
jgi:hypothetical protein